MSTHTAGTLAAQNTPFRRFERFLRAEWMNLSLLIILIILAAFVTRNFAVVVLITLTLVAYVEALREERKYPYDDIPGLIPAGFYISFALLTILAIAVTLLFRLF